VSLLIVWLISQMTLLSWADLSFVMPVTSIGYVLSALMGRVFLHEQVSWRRWAGIGIIMLGVILVSRTHPAGGKKASPADSKTEMACS
jgi:drug/metabolite transporter (DMT)-like permease